MDNKSRKDNRNDSRGNEGKARGVKVRGAAGSSEEKTSSMNVQSLKEMNITSLINYSKSIGLKDVSSLKKQEIIFKILESQSERKIDIYGE